MYASKGKLLVSSFLAVGLLILVLITLQGVVPVVAAPPRAPLSRPLALDVNDDITESTLWTLDNSPYVLYGDIVVTPGVTLTLAPGVVVSGTSSSQLKVRGRLVALGTVTQPITFTSDENGGPFEWEGLIFDGGTGHLDHVTVRNGGRPNGIFYANIVVSGVLNGEVRIENSHVLTEGYLTESDCGLYVFNSRVVVSGTQFSGNSYALGLGNDYAVWATGDRTMITFTNNTISDNPNHAVRLETGHLHNVWMVDNSFYNNGDSRVRIMGGPISGTATLRSQNGLQGYELDDDSSFGTFVVPPGATLEVEPGVTVMGQDNAELQVRGHLQALGASDQPITFTRDTAGQESWRGLVFDGGTGELHHATVLYGGTTGSSAGVRSNIAVSGVLDGQVRIVEGSSVMSSTNVYGLYVRDGHVTVGDTTFQGNGNNTSAFALYSAGPNTVITLTHNRFYTNTGCAVGVGTDHLHQVHMIGNDLNDNDRDRVLIEGESLAESATLASQTRMEGYELDESLTISPGVTLDVAPGVVVMGPGGGELQVMGHLQALGTAAQPVTFTSEQDSAPGDWSGLVFNGGTGTLDHATVRYGGDSNSLIVQSNIAINDVLDGWVTIKNSRVLSESRSGADYGVYVANGQVAISGTTFSDNGNDGQNDYALYTSGPNTAISLTHNHFYTNSSWAIGVGADHLHRAQLAGNDFAGNAENRVLILGDELAASVALIPQAGLEGYELKQNLTVPATATLDVAPGVVVMGPNATELQVLGHLQALGTEIQPIVFTSADDSAPGQWSGLVFDGGTGELNHVTVRYGGGQNSLNQFSNIAMNDVLAGQVTIKNSQVLSESRVAVGDYGMYLANSRATISDTTFIGNGGGTNDYALYTTGPSTAITLTSSRFYTNSGYPIQVETDHLYQVQMTQNDFDGNYRDRVLVEGASLVTSATLTPQSGLVGYELKGDLTISREATLDVMPGVTVMAPPLSELRVLGRLRALGTGGQPVVFTSKDDSNAGEWDGLVFESGTGELDHVTLRYGGYNGYGLYAIGANAALSLSNSSLYTNSGYPIGLGAEHLHRVQMWGNSFEGNARQRVLIAGDAVLGEANLSPQAGLEGYEIERDLTISTGVTLSVEPGVRVMMRQGWNDLRVRGHLRALGTAAQPIVFTSVTDNDSGQWAGLVFDGGTGDLRHVTVRYGGAPNGLLPGGNEEGSNILARNILTGLLNIESSQVLSVSHTTAEGTDYGLYVQDSHVVISGTTFQDNGNRAGDYALYITGTHAAITVALSTMQGNGGDGTHLAGGSATLGCASFAENGGDGIHVSGGNLAVMGADIHDNTGFGLNNTSGVTVSALYNWWGSPSGPTHPSNPGGSGDEVSDDVAYVPFLSEPQCVSDLEVSKLGRPDPVYVHDDLVYTITVNNNSALPVTGIVLTDNLPAHVTLGAVAASQGQCDGTDEVVTCELGTLAGQARPGYKPIHVTLVISPSVAALQQIENQALIASADYDPWTDNNAAYVQTTVQPQADLSIAKSSQPAVVRVGRPMTYTLVVTNDGPSISTGIRVTDTLPEGMELQVIWSSADCDVTPGLITCDLFPMSGGASTTIDIVVVPTQSGTAFNTARVSSDIHDRRADNNVATETVMVYAEDYCEAVSGVQIERTPAGDLFAGDTVRFTARAKGSVPFTHTWTLDGATVGGDTGAFEHTFGASGTYSVGATVENACGQGSDATLVEVQTPVPGQPDLSGSSKSVNRLNVGGGDVLTYTLVLRNRSAAVATLVLTDPLPAHTTFLAGSAQASDGTPVTLESGQVRWSGQVISGTPVVIQFAVVVTTSTLELGTPMNNVAWLEDGLGHVARLEARSVYNPGYQLSINDGALYTNAPLVTLTLAWEAAHAPVEMRLSNDGGFGTGSGWVPIAPTYGGWSLDTYGLLTLPRTVYARFRDEDGLQYGPVQDDIIYDPNPPRVTGVEIMRQPGSLLNVTVQVRASDDNSGVGKLQLGHDADLSQFSEYPVSGSTTEIPWVLQTLGPVYVRAVDRAGNLSSIVEGQYKLYLPIVLKNP